MKIIKMLTGNYKPKLRSALQWILFSAVLTPAIEKDFPDSLNTTDFPAGRSGGKNLS
jgi:hypothetical protein